MRTYKQTKAVNEIVDGAKRNGCQYKVIPHPAKKDVALVAIRKKGHTMVKRVEADGAVMLIAGCLPYFKGLEFEG